MNKITQLEQNGGITVPKNFNVGNQINLAMLKLSGMKDKANCPVLQKVTPESVASALFNMCILGLSMEKNQCYFIPYGNELQFQPSYHGRVALAKRLGGAGEPQAQIIYEGDVFEYVINPKTGKKEVIKHEQKMQNIDNAKIIGAWCIIPYEGRPELDPKVEIMTMAEIRRSWAQGATKGQSGAHQNFTQEMVKKTIINRACKMFISTSDDAGIVENVDRQDAEFQSQPENVAQNATEAMFEALPSASSAEAVQDTAEAVDVAENAPFPQDEEGDGLDANFFNA